MMNLHVMPVTSANFISWIIQLRSARYVIILKQNILIKADQIAFTDDVVTDVITRESYETENDGEDEEENENNNKLNNMT